MNRVLALPLEQAVGQQLMLAFSGHTPSADILATLRRHPVGGITLFRALNVADPIQVRALTDALQAAAAATDRLPLLIGADQEGGTLMALAGTTEFPGNMALGATGSTDLARQTGYATGRELAAMGVNVNYAPVADVNSNAHNPVVGTRSFGSDPAAVARLTGALISGLQAAGVAATVKHFPGHGDTGMDSHLGTPVVLHDMARLRAVELPPFAAAVQAGVRLVMTAHIALPSITGGSNPATLSPAVLRGLLREELGFTGVIVSDAMDMGAITQGRGLLVDVLASTAAGVDLLLLSADPASHSEIYSGLLQAAQRGLLDPDRVQAAAARVLDLKAWIAVQVQPPPEIIACADHRALAATVAAQAVTLVRDEAGRLPLRLAATARIAAVVPQPADLTPADTSSYVTPALAAALRHYHPAVVEFRIPLDPNEGEIADLRARLADFDLVVIGTINAGGHIGQAALVNALLADGTSTVAVALRLPYDLQAYPTAPTYLCTYSILELSMTALAGALWGIQPCTGRLPVSIPDLYPLGHGLGIATR